jgi:hypothetical protein
MDLAADGFKVPAGGRLPGIPHLRQQWQAPAGPAMIS